MTALTDLAAEYTTQIATISETILNLRATYLLERWQAAVAALASLESGQITSYSVGNRSFTRHTIQAFQEQISSLEAELWAMIYGTTGLVDANTNVGEP